MRSHRLPKSRLTLWIAATLAVGVLSPSLAQGAKGELSFTERVPEYDLGSATGLAVSPDGEQLYATGGDQLTVLDRDPATGEFEYLEAERDGVDDLDDPGGVVDGLSPTRDVTVSADGKTVYTLGWQSDNAVAVFDRDPLTGRVSFVERERHGEDDPDDPGGAVQFMFRPEALAVSPDGGSLYVVTSSDESIVVFDRDAETGQLSYVESQQSVDLDQSTDVAVAPDGEAVYTTSQSDRVVAFERDTESGELTFVETERDGIDDPEDPGGTVDGLNGPASIAVGPGGGFVYVASRFDDAVVMFKRDTGSEELSFVEAEIDGQNDAGDPGGTVSGLGSPEGVAVSPDGANVYIAATGSDSVATFRFSSGEVVFVESEQAGADPEDGGATPSGPELPRDVAIAPEGAHVYLNGSGQSGLSTFSRGDPASPTFGELGFLFSAPMLSVNEPRGAALTPDGEHLILATLGDRSLRSFARNPADGSLQLRDTETSEVDDESDPGPEAKGLEEPKAIAIDPNGTDVYVTDTGSYAVSLYELDPSAGELTYVESEVNGVDDLGDAGGEVHGLNEPWDVLVSADGKGLFTIGSNEDSVAAFDRDPATGALSFVEREQEGVDGAEGLDGVQSLAISPDGRNLYAGGRSGYEAAVFARDPVTNQLTFLEDEQEGEDDPTDPGGAVEGFDSGPNDVIVSRDGGSVFFGGSRGLVRFDRDQVTGLISFGEGVDPAEAAGAPVGTPSSVSELEASVDGGELYAGSEGTLLVFGIGGGTIGSLLDAESNGVDDPGDVGPKASGISNLEGLVISPEDSHLYALSEDENGIAIFAREGLASIPTAPPAAPAPPAPPPPPVVAAPHAVATPPAVATAAADTRLRGGKVKVVKTQTQSRKRILVKVRVKAGEAARGTVYGKVEIGKRSYGLRKVSGALAAKKWKLFRLKLAKPKRLKPISRRLSRGAKVRAKLTSKIVDRAGNRYSRTVRVTLKHRKRR